jgi:hypothetical protein
MRELVKIKQAFLYFQNNKLWIIGILYISSIIKESIWYSVFGINILNFTSIQDTFISFFNHTIIFIIIIFIYLLVQFIFAKSKKNKVLDFVKVIFTIGLSFIYFQLFKKPISFIIIFALFIVIYSKYSEKKYSEVLIFLAFFLIGFSTIEPLSQAFLIKNKNRKVNTQFEWNESNMDYYSFEYEKNKYDTKLKKYFLIGSNKDYFFIFDKIHDKSLIIPKDKCKNIIAEFSFF